ncbi:MAG: hypothetical protein R2813_05125 [Flavobacteriales bacterium]
MTKFESSHFNISMANATVADFLAIPSNLQEILPQDRIEDWKSDKDKCSFKIKGLAHISLKLVSHEPHCVVYASDSDKPFAFELIVNMDETGNQSCDLSASFDADVNSFMGAMLKSPLTNFLNSLGEALKQKFG